LIRSHCSFVNSYRFMLIVSHNLVSCTTFIFQTRPNREQLVKTIGHEFVHLKQAKEHGIITSMEDLMEREREAYESEAKWWDDYCKKTGFGR